MDFKSKIRKLVWDFENENTWKSSEEHIQTLFTSRLLEILGYRVGNIRINKGQEVKTGKIPDILLLNDSGNTLLVIESKDAKKSESLDSRYKSKTFIEQLLGYCRAEGIHWGILTNFVEWRIYSVYQNRLYLNKKFAFHELLWPGINKEDYVDLLSDEGIRFLELISKDKLVRSKGRIDDDPVYYPKQDEIKEKFFQDLKKWRSNIRNYISKNYSHSFELSKIDLMTQQILDRLIFIDYCADNNIITQDRLHAIVHSKEKLYQELRTIFLDMDEKFNSELFSQSDCDLIEIEDSVLRPVIIELSNTDFSKLTVHVLGEVYENYLGELLQSGRKGEIIDKKKTQIKGSHGIYYTPDFIVNYIVENTVGIVLSKCKTLHEISQVKVLDPACGSGSFLIRVFDEFLKHHERISPIGLYHFEVRKKILQNNIYGIDLDERAVEIAKLNLLVKALEGSARTSLTGRKLLPNLKLNIRCGNSLIFGEGNSSQMELFRNQHFRDLAELTKLTEQYHHEKYDDSEKEKLYSQIQIIEDTVNRKLNKNLFNYFENPDNVRPMNYSVLFPQVKAAGGFDCIVGNPPYLSYYARFKQEMLKKEEIYYKEHYEFISESNRIIDKNQIKGKFNTVMFFFERSIHLLKDRGLCSFIVDLNIIKEPYKDIRQYLVNTASISEIVTDIEGWGEVGSGQIIINYQKGLNSNKKIRIKKTLLDKSPRYEQQSSFISFFTDFNNRKSKKDSLESIIKKIENNSKKLSEIFPNKLIRTSINFAGKKSTFLTTRNANDAKPLAEGGDSITHKYCIPQINSYIKYDKNIIHSINKSNNKKEIAKQNKQGKVGGLGDISVFLNPKIIVRQAGESIVATFYEKELYLDYSLFSISKGDGPNFKSVDLKEVLAILNSKLISFYAWNKNIIEHGKGGTPQIRIKGLRNIPYPNLTKEASVALSQLTDSILKLNKDTNTLQNNKIRIQSLSREIDQIVYQIYGLTESEINIIENSK